MEYNHEPVMLDECIEALKIKRDGLYLDATAGLGGHSLEIASRIPEGRLICLDKDQAALAACAERLAAYGERVSLMKSDFRNMGEVLGRLGVGPLDGVLMDLGVSSMQLDKPERGFSYRFDAPLDMRMDPDSPFGAHTVVNTWSEKELARILFEYGEERYALRIAAAIARNRPLETTAELSRVARDAMPAKARRENQHPARRTFQAIRIAVNDELGALREGLCAAVESLGHGGRIAVISFHSLEDRIVKNAFRELEGVCVCPPDFPVCVCGQRKILKTAGTFTPRPEEAARNPRSECARLRVAERI